MRARSYTRMSVHRPCISAVVMYGHLFLRLSMPLPLRILGVSLRLSMRGVHVSFVRQGEVCDAPRVRGGGGLRAVVMGFEGMGVLLLSVLLWWLYAWCVGCWEGCFLTQVWGVWGGVGDFVV